jgi:hypothetical protein
MASRTLLALLRCYWGPCEGLLAIGPSGANTVVPEKKNNEIQNFRRINSGNAQCEEPIPACCGRTANLTFQNDLGWPVDDSGEKLDGEFLPETPGEAARRRIDSVLNILEDWDN